MRPVWRLRETLLLLVAGALVLLGAAIAIGARGEEVTLEGLRIYLIVLGGVFALHLGLCLGGSRADPVLLPVVTAISGIGLVMVGRLVEPEIAQRQAIWLMLGLIAAAGALLVTRRLGWLRTYKYSFAAIGLLLVGLTFVFGRDLNGSGARLWLSLGPVNIQPSELLKVLLVIFLAAYLDEHGTILERGHYRVGPLALPPVPYLVPVLVMWGLAVALVVVQRDLGAALLLFGIFVTMLYLASGRLLFLLGSLGAFAAAVWVAYQIVPIFRGRVDIWLDPFSRASGLGYQAVQALIALASGGVFGSGIGLGRPDLVPAVHTDFILVAIGEEIGLAGTLGLLALFAILVVRGYRAAREAPTDFARLLAAGLTSVLAIQTLVIIGGTLRLMPLTGITLPFVSYGGSSILTNFVILGLLLRVADRGAAS